MTLPYKEGRLSDLLFISQIKKGQVSQTVLGLKSPEEIKVVYR